MLKRIRGCEVQTEQDVVRADILIDEHRIAGLVDPDLDTGVTEDIDASGLVALPGLIDLHAHVRTPGLSHKEDFTTASTAAAVGGFTAFVDMPNVEPPTDSVELLEEKKAIAAQTCLIDWGHFASGTRPEQIGPLAEAGATGYKIFMVGGGYPHDDRIAMHDFGELFRSLSEVVKTGLPCMIHPFVQGVFDELWRREIDGGAPDNDLTFARVYTRECIWSPAVAAIVEIVRETGARVQVLHTHASRSLRLVAQAKRDGLPITCAIDPKYYQVTKADLETHRSRVAPAGHVGEDPGRIEAIREALRDGTIDVIDSDHAPHLLAEVQQAETKAQGAALGSPQYDHELMLLLTDVNHGHMSLQRLTELLSSSPAKVIGQYPERGTIRPGSRADLTFVDLDHEHELQDSDVKAKPGWTPYRGRKTKGAAMLTMLRGQVVAERGEVRVDPGNGEYVAGTPQR